MTMTRHSKAALAGAASQSFVTGFAGNGSTVSVCDDTMPAVTHSRLKHLLAAILILKRNVHHCPSGPAFPGSAGVSPAPEAAKMAALPGGWGTVMTLGCGCLPRREPK